MKGAGAKAADRGAGEALTLEAALKRLEEIAARLETGSLDLETSLALYREARDLHAICVTKLAAAEHDLQILMADGSLQAEATPGDPERE
jgi:exodeoxyribonuclease VII small subunit